MTPKLQQYLLYQGAIHIEHIYGSVIITAYAKKYALLLTNLNLVVQFQGICGKKQICEILIQRSIILKEIFLLCE